MLNKLQRELPKIFISAFFSITCTAEAAVTTLNLNGLEMGIDETTGNIVYLSYPATGVILQTRPESAGILDLAYPIESFAALRLASRFSKARLYREEHGLTIGWEELGPSRTSFKLPAGKISAQVKIRAAADGRSVTVSCRIENKSEASIPQVIFPDLWGLKPFDGIERTELRLARGVVQPFAQPIKAEHSTPFYVNRGWKEYTPGGYYSENALRWLDYGSLRGGLSIFQKKWGTDDRPTIRTHRSEADPMSLRLLWEHKVTIEPGQTWESGEFWMTPHRGGWAKGIEAYREFVKQVNPPRELPRHVRDGLGFQTIWMIQTVEMDPAKAAFRYSDLPRIAQDAIEHGIDEIVPWGWCTYSTMPIPLRDELGSRQEFLEGVRKAKELGVNIAPFISIQIVRNRYADRYGVKPGTSDWTYHYELIPNFRPYYTKFWDGAIIESDNKVWQQDVLASLTEWINLGLCSFSWDVFSTKSVGGRKPDLVSLIERARGLARAKDPESTFSAESVSAGSLEHDPAVVDYTWNWIGYVDAGPILNVLRAPRLNCNVEDSPLVVKKAFCDGLYINVIPRKKDLPNGTALISEVPELARALKEVAGLRKKFLKFFVDGTFIGGSVLSQPASAFVRGHQLGDKLLITVLNDRSESQNVIVHSDLDLWLSSTGKYRVKYYDLKGRLVDERLEGGTRWFGVTDRLQPLELAFFEIERL